MIPARPAFPSSFRAMRGSRGGHPRGRSLHWDSHLTIRKEGRNGEGGLQGAVAVAQAGGRAEPRGRWWQEAGQRQSLPNPVLAWLWEQRRKATGEALDVLSQNCKTGTTYWKSQVQRSWSEGKGVLPFRDLGSHGRTTPSCSFGHTCCPSHYAGCFSHSWVRGGQGFRSEGEVPGHSGGAWMLWRMGSSEADVATGFGTNTQEWQEKREWAQKEVSWRGGLRLSWPVLRGAGEQILPVGVDKIPGPAFPGSARPTV